MKRIRVTGWMEYDNEFKYGEVAISRSDGKTRYHRMTKASSKRFGYCMFKMLIGRHLDGETREWGKGR